MPAMQPECSSNAFLRRSLGAWKFRANAKLPGAEILRCRRARWNGHVISRREQDAGGAILPDGDVVKAERITNFGLHSAAKAEFYQIFDYFFD